MEANINSKEVFFTMNFDDISMIIKKIEVDIRYLHDMGVRHNRIRIAMPNYFLKFLEHYWRSEIPAFHINSYNFDKVFFGAKICLGYNNEVCVFDEDALPKDSINQPIKIKI